MSLNEAYKDKLTDQTFHYFKRKTTSDFPTLGNDSIIGPCSQRAQELFDLRERRKEGSRQHRQTPETRAAAFFPLFLNIRKMLLQFTLNKERPVKRTGIHCLPST